jgi:hypothetical protein
MYVDVLMLTCVCCLFRRRLFYLESGQALVSKKEDGRAIKADSRGGG